MPHGLAVSGTKFNISEVKVKDYAHKFFCHFIYGSEQFTAYIKLERPGKKSHLDKMEINDAYFSVSLTIPYLELKLCCVPLCKVGNAAQYLCEIFVIFLANLKKIVFFICFVFSHSVS